MRYDHQNAAALVHRLTRSSHGTSATHAHHGWVKFGKERMRRLALLQIRSARYNAILWPPEEALGWNSVDVLAVMNP